VAGSFLRDQKESNVTALSTRRWLSRCRGERPFESR
jgi:hypothetical protein